MSQPFLSFVVKIVNSFSNFARLSSANDDCPYVLAPKQRGSEFTSPTSMIHQWRLAKSARDNMCVRQIMRTSACTDHADEVGASKISIGSGLVWLRTHSACEMRWNTAKIGVFADECLSAAHFLHQTQLWRVHRYCGWPRLPAGCLVQHSQCRGHVLVTF